MSDAPSPPTRPARPRTAWGEIAAWLVLIVLALGIFVMQRGGGAPPEPGALPDPANVDSPVLRLSGRYLVGTRSLGQLAGGSEQIAESAAREFDALATSPIDRLRAAILVGEFAGPEEALDRLDTLALDLDQAEPPQPDTEAPDDAPDEGAPDESPAPGEPGNAGGAATLAGDIETLRTLYAEGSDALSADRRDELIDHHGWFARVALAHDADADDPFRKKLKAEGQRMLAIVLTAMLIIALAGVAGFVLLVIALTRYLTGRLTMRYPSMVADAPAPAAPFIAATALFLVGFVVLSALGGLLSQATGINLAPIVLWLALPIAFTPVFMGVGPTATLAALGWSAPRGVIREVIAGIVGYLAGLPIVAAGLLMALVLMQVIDAPPRHQAVESMLGGGWWTTVSLYLLACVWAPVVEETFFRGAFYHALRARCGSVLEPALLTGFVFAFIHPQGIAAIPALMSLGVVFALIREWRGSIIAPVVAHTVNNGFIITMLLLATS